MDEKVKGRFAALIPTPNGGGVYAVPAAAGAGWTLPSFDTTAPNPTGSHVALIEREAAAALGLPLHFLGCPQMTRGEGDLPYQAVAIFEPAARGETSSSAVTPLAAADAAHLLPAEHAALVADTLAEWSTGAHPPERAPWMTPGWRAEAVDWIQASLARHNLTPNGPPVVQRLWSLSCLIRQPTTGGEVFFKAVPALFAVEPPLTRFLAGRFPGEVAGVLATNPRHWLLMHAFAGGYLADEAALDVWCAALRRYAEMQVALASHADELRALGCPLRPPSALPDQMRLVLNDAEALWLDRPRGLTSAEHQALLDGLPAFDECCVRFTALGLPVTLEHGDLHAHNIAVRPEGGFVYFDWTDGCLTQPMLGLAPFLEGAKPEWHAALCAAYLEPWRAFVAEADLQAALAQARVLSALHLAVSYYFIHHAIEPRHRWEVGGALAYFLREALKHTAAI